MGPHRAQKTPSNNQPKASEMIEETPFDGQAKVITRGYGMPDDDPNAGADGMANGITVILNWLQEVTQRVPPP